MNDTVEPCPIEDPFSADYFKEIPKRVLFFGLLVFCTVFTIFTVAISIESIVYIRSHILLKQRRNHMTWVMGIFPVHSVIALLALYVPRSMFIGTIHASLYLSIALYRFFLLLTDYYGGREIATSILIGTKIPLDNTPVLCLFRCLPKLTCTKNSLVWMKRGVMQVAFIRPTSLFIAAVLWTDGNYTVGEVSPRKAYIYLHTVVIISTLVAMNFLSMMIRVSKVHLKSYNLTPKFLAVQLTLILANIQHLLFSIVVALGWVRCDDPFTMRTRTNALYNILLIAEMLVLCIFARCFYRRRSGNMGSVESSSKNTVSIAEEPLLDETPSTTQSTIDYEDKFVQTDQFCYYSPRAETESLYKSSWTVEIGDFSDSCSVSVGERRWDDGGSLPGKESPLSLPTDEIMAEDPQNGETLLEYTNNHYNGGVDDSARLFDVEQSFDDTFG
ncbi:organic solute transporter subunit alpha-like [Saccoglossus kowalevskii]